MGEVYRAEDTRLGREIAIKVLPERFSASGSRFLYHYWGCYVAFSNSVEGMYS